MTNKHANKYENLVVHCKFKEEWDWVFDNLPEGYSDLTGIKNINFTPNMVIFIYMLVKYRIVIVSFMLIN